MKRILSLFIIFLFIFMTCNCKTSDDTTNPGDDTVVHEHSLEYHPAMESSFFNAGSETEYYYCGGCGKYFDAAGNEITPHLLPRLSTALSIGVNGEIKGDFIVDESELEIDHLSWKYENLTLKKDDAITIHSKNDTNVTYDFIADTQSNITEDNKVHNDVSSATIAINGTPNGLYLSITGFEYDGIVIKINDTEYPMNKVSYYEDNTQTYIYGYKEIAINDKVVIIDKDNDVTYDYDDFVDYIKWNTFDYHKGDNNEIIFDFPSRYGFEFDRGGDKKISITKIFAPNDTNEVALDFSSEREDISLKDYYIDKSNPEYESTLWYIQHENVINNSDILSFIETNGLHMYIESVNLEENELFNLKDLTNNLIIKGDHLTDVHCFNLSGNFSISDDYIKVLKSGNYSIAYLPLVSSISIFEVSSSLVDAYILVDGEFVSLTKDSDNIVHYEKENSSEFGETCAFADGSYNIINFTLDPSVDNTLIKKNDNNTFTLLKKGNYKLHLNLNTSVLTIEFSAEEVTPPTIKNYKFYDSNGGQSSAFSPEFVINSENEQEYCLLNYTVQNGWLALVDMSSGSMETINNITLTEGSTIATPISYFFVIQAGKTCNFYYNPTTNTLRIVEVL